MIKLIDFFKFLINSISGLWDIFFRDIRTLIMSSEFLLPLQKSQIIGILPNSILNLNLLSLLSIGFITFLLIWSLVKVFTNIL